ncbi:izumo sperm-egg fusion protein 2 [Ascaphus truei]|uniref:izumo sperm-egg fusion protein 2 n=1 Tax=Ascaphus truei TaxID=8439 RepID=UPI003F59101C
MVEKVKTIGLFYIYSPHKDQEFLDSLVNFRKHITLELKEALKSYHDKACSPTECGWLKLAVFSCSTCGEVKPLCLNHKACMADKEKRISLRFEGEFEESMLTSKSLSIVSCSALFLFAVLATAILTYRRNTNLLIERTMEV